LGEEVKSNFAKKNKMSTSLEKPNPEEYVIHNFTCFVSAKPMAITPLNISESFVDSGRIKSIQPTRSLIFPVLTAILEPIGIIHSFPPPVSVCKPLKKAL